jgi:DNA adenine methylase
MKPFFCRIGSKRDLAKRIIKLIPEHSVYVEPFFGGGAVYFRKEPSEREVINDLDSDLIRDYKLLATIRSREFPKSLNTVTKIQRFVDNPPNSQVADLTYAILTRCNGFGGQEGERMYTDSNPFSKLKKIDEYQERMKNTKLLNKDYRTVIKQYDSPDTFFYLDPPYEDSADLYEEGSMDYEDMRKRLDKVKGKWLLSINNSKYIRDVFKGYTMKRILVKAKSNNIIGGKNRTELLIANYDI